MIIVPVDFDVAFANKVHSGNKVSDNRKTVTSETNGVWKAAIATDGVPSHKDGDYAFPIKIPHADANAHIMSGWTPLSTFASNAGSNHPGQTTMLAAALDLHNGYRYGVSGGAATEYLSINIKNCKELINQLQIRNGGQSKTVRWVVDGKAGPWAECAAQLAGERIYPMVSLHTAADAVQVVSLDELTIRTGDAKEVIDAHAAAANPHRKQLLSRAAFSHDFVSLLAKKLKGSVVHSVFVGLSDTGKSTVVNMITSILNGEKMGGRSAGAGTLAGGQHSTHCFRESVSFHLAPEEWDVEENGDLIYTDCVGTTGQEGELVAVGLGLLNMSETYPRDSSEASNIKRSEILKRPPPPTRPTCFVLFISCRHVVENDKSLDHVVTSIIEAAKSKFKVGESPFEIALKVVITKVDTYESCPTPEDLLLQRNSPALQPIFKKCSERFGVSEDDILALGFMNETDQIDFSAETECPQVIAVRELMLCVAQTAQITQKRLRAVEADNARAARQQQQQQQQQLQQQQRQQQQQRGTVAAFADNNNNDRDAQMQLIEAEMKTFPSKQDFVKAQSKHKLFSILTLLGVADAICKAFLERGYDGTAFALNNFVGVALKDDVRKKFDIDELQVATFVEVREKLLRH